MSGWRWRSNLPHRLCDPPVPHTNTRPHPDPEPDPAGNAATPAAERAPDNRSPRHRDGQR